MKLLADFIIVSGFVVTTVIFSMLVLSKRKELPRHLLSCILGLNAIILITLYASLHEIKSLFVFANLFEDSARFLLGPLIYLYIKSIFIKEDGMVKRHWFHFVPFLVYWFLVSLPKMIGNFREADIFEYIELLRNPYLAMVKDLFLIGYLFLSFRLFFAFKIKMKSNYSSFTNSNYGWVKRFLLAFLLATLFDFTVVIIYTVFKPVVTWDLGVISIASLVLITFFLGYHGLKQSVIYLPQFLIDTNEVTKNDNQSQFKLMLSDEEIEILQNKLDMVILEQKPYLQQELTLNGLANLVGTTDRNLSTYLNRELKTTFYDYINKFRVEEVKEKLQSKEQQKYSLLGLAFSAGFNSKSSFYRAFKKETGISPTEFKKKIAS